MNACFSAVFLSQTKEMVEKELGETGGNSVLKSMFERVFGGYWALIVSEDGHLDDGDGRDGDEDGHNGDEDGRDGE